MLPDRLPTTEVPDYLPAFVDHVLLTTLTSGNKKSVWCSEWREHPDAVTRLAAIADAWNHMIGAGAEADGDADVDLHSFLRDVLDHHMPMLVDNERGAFAGCNYGHKPVRMLDDVTAGTGGR